MIKLIFQRAVTLPKDIGLTCIVGIKSHHNRYLNVNVWNEKKADTQQITIWNIPITIWSHPWSLRQPPVQFARVMVASFVSAPSTRAIYHNVCHMFCPCSLAVGRVDFQTVCVCACRRCNSAEWLSDPWSLRLPPVQFTVYKSFRPQCHDGSIWRCRFPRPCCVEWFSRWFVLRLLWFDATRITRKFFAESLSPLSLLFLTTGVWMVGNDSSTFVGRLHMSIVCMPACVNIVVVTIRSFKILFLFAQCLVYSDGPKLGMPPNLSDFFPSSKTNVCGPHLECLHHTKNQKLRKIIRIFFQAYIGHSKCEWCSSCFETVSVFQCHPAF